MILKTRLLIFLPMFLSAVGALIASLVMSVDAITLAADPDANLSCNINSALSCGSVAVSDQASLFGFPNSFIGLMAEPVIITVAIAGMSGVVFKRWFMFIAQLAYLLGLIFALWLFYESAFNIGALCPWCMLVTVCTIVTFFTLLKYNVMYNNLFLPKRLTHILTTAYKLGLNAVFVSLSLGIVAIIVVVKYGWAFI